MRANWKRSVGLAGVALAAAAPCSAGAQLDPPLPNAFSRIRLLPVPLTARGLADPLAVNVAAGRLWVTTNSDGRLLRLRLPD